MTATPTRQLFARHAGTRRRHLAKIAADPLNADLHLWFAQASHGNSPRTCPMPS